MQDASHTVVRGRCFCERRPSGITCCRHVSESSRVLHELRGNEFSHKPFSKGFLLRSPAVVGCWLLAEYTRDFRRPVRPRTVDSPPLLTMNSAGLVHQNNRPLGCLAEEYTSAQPETRRTAPLPAQHLQHMTTHTSTQKAQYPLIKEYSLNHNLRPYTI